MVARLSGVRQSKDENPKQLKFSSKRKASAAQEPSAKPGKAEAEPEAADAAAAEDAEEEEAPDTGDDAEAPGSPSQDRSRSGGRRRKGHKRKPAGANEVMNQQCLPMPDARVMKACSFCLLQMVHEDMDGIIMGCVFGVM